MQNATEGFFLLLGFILAVGRCMPFTNQSRAAQNPYTYIKALNRSSRGGPPDEGADAALATSPPKRARIVSARIAKESSNDGTPSPAS